MVSKKSTVNFSKHNFTRLTGNGTDYLVFPTVCSAADQVASFISEPDCFKTPVLQDLK